MSIMVVGGGLELSRRVSRIRSDRLLTISEKRPHEKFYHGLMVNVKCTYQNLELINVRDDVAKMSSTILCVGLVVPFIRRSRRGTCKTKDSDTQVSMRVR